jgi:hypothetical protein
MCLKTTNDEQVARAKTAREQVAILFPLETWREIESNIFIAGSREPKVKGQRQVLEKELVQARILTGQGSTVYLLPEIAGPDNIGVKHPDAIVDGYLMEFKTITGSINQVEHRFRESRKKAEYVFFKIDSHLTRETVLSKLIDRIRRSDYSGGMVVAHFTEVGKTYFWNVDDLK